MSKVITIILIVTSLFVVGLSIIAVLLNKNNQPVSVSRSLQPTPSITAINTLALVPQSLTVLKDQTNTIDVVFESSTRTILPRVIQMEIAYDPNALFDVTITPGSFFTKPTESLKVINTNTGRISYALEASVPSTPTTDNTQITKGTVARITFTPNPAFANLETSLSFLGKTKIQGETESKIMTATYGIKLLFATPSATQN